MPPSQLRARIISKISNKMLLRYLLNRQPLCRRCLFFIEPPTQQHRSLFLLPREFSTAIPRLYLPKNGLARETTGAPPELPNPPPKGAKPRNDEIIPLNGEVRYIDAGQENRGIVPLASIINAFDRSEYVLICMNPQAIAQNEPPTCRLTSISEMLEKEAREAKAEAEAEAKRKNKPTIATRVLEFTWAIAGNDLAHKMKKMGELLTKGNRVEVILGTRRGMAKLRKAELEGLVGRIKEAAGEFGKEWKSPQGQLGTQYTLYFEGKAPEKAEEAVEEKEEVKWLPKKAKWRKKKEEEATAAGRVGGVKAEVRHGV